MDITKIDSWLYLSSEIDDYNKLVEYNISAVVNCRLEAHDDIMALSERKIAYYYIPFADATAPQRWQIKQFLDITEKQVGITLVHCTLGVGRSPLLAIAYMMSNYKCSIGEALYEIRSKREHISLNDVQMDKLKSYFRVE